MRKPRWRTDEDGIAALAAFVREEVPLVDEGMLQLEHAEGEEAAFVARLAQHAAKNPALVAAELYTRSRSPSLAVSPNA